MKKERWIVAAFGVVFFALLFLGCQSEPQKIEQVIPAPPIQAPQPVAPVAAPPPAPPAEPPPTPLIPVIEDKKEGQAQTDKVDKPLPGETVSGDDLLGNYSCRLDSAELKLGPLKLPEFGCRIFKAQDGSLKVGSTASGATSINGDVTSPTEGGFFIEGGYQLPGNKISLKTRMIKSGGEKAQFTGNGRGTLNDDKSHKIKYSLTMVKK